MQGFEPAFVQMFVTELAVEALYVAVLHGATRLDIRLEFSCAGEPRGCRLERPMIWQSCAYTLMEQSASSRWAF